MTKRKQKKMKTSINVKDCVTALMKRKDGEWCFEGKPHHVVVMSKFLESLQPGVVLMVITSAEYEDMKSISDKD
jgi:hypothetical protein